MKIVIATPTITRPKDAYLSSLEASVDALDAAGIEHQTVFEIGCPYISHARATMLRKALDANADAVIFIDHDVEWRPQDIVKLVQTDGDVVAGTYRFKKDDVQYMATIDCHADGTPIVRSDGCIKADKVPAGFLRVTRQAVRKFMRAYPELVYGHPEKPAVDLFNHGAYQGVWYGEDYSFSRRWNDCCGDIWLIPDLNLNHHGDKAYLGNYHEFLMRQPGGSKENE